MIPLAFAGKRFADLGVSANFLNAGAAGATRSPVAITRAGDAPTLAGMQQGVRTLSITFTIFEQSDPNALALDLEEIRMGLLAAIDPRNDTPRTLVARRSAVDTTELELLCSPGQYRFPSPNTIQVDFVTASDAWSARYGRETTQVAVAGSTAFPLYNKSGASVSPVIKIPWTTQRSTEAATIGWKYKKVVTPSNISGRRWKRVRMTFDLGDTAALVTAGKALASGDDLRIRRGRREFARTLTNWNTKRTFAHIFDTIENGDTATYECWYGNPDATAPQTLSVRTLNADDYAADDLEGYAGVATAGTTGTLTDSGATWETNEWRYGFIGLVSGTGSLRWRRIASNTGTVITFNRLVATAPDNTTAYVLWRSGMFYDGGRVTSRSANSITDNLHTDQWGPNSLKGATVTFVGGSGATPSTMTVAGNTVDTLTFTGSFSVQPAVNDNYLIQRYGIMQWNTNRGVYGRDHRGLWRTNLYFSKGGQVIYGDRTPGGWMPWLMLDNQDDFAQGRYVDEGSGGGHAINIQPYQYSRRSVRSDNTWPEKKQADGVAIFDPRRFIGFDWNYQMKNEGTTPVGSVEVRTQAADGDNWQTVASDATARSSLVNVTSGGATGHVDMSADDDLAVRIWTGVLPYDGVVIPSTARKDYSVELRDHTKRIAYLDISGCGGLSSSIWAVGSETAIYDLQPTLRIGGGSASVPPYDKFIGGDGLGLESGQELWINASPTPAAPLFGVYASDVLVRRAPWAGVIYHHELDLDGNDTAVIARKLLAIPPAVNLVANEDDIANWSIANSAGVTASIANDTTPLFDGDSSVIKVTISATPVGAWTVTLTYQTISLVPGTLYEFAMAYRRNGLTNAILCQMTSTWTKDGAVSGSDSPQTVGSAMANADQWYTAGSGKKIFAGSASADPTTEAHLAIVISGTGSTSGTVYLDSVTMGVPNAYINESEIGVLGVRASLPREWYG